MRQIDFRAKIKVEANDSHYTAEEKDFLESELHDVVSIRFDNHCCISLIHVPYRHTVMPVFADYCDIQLMQYTGVKDMDGQKIYEGYILSDEYDTTAVVKYEEDAMFTIVYADICTNFSNERSTDWVIIGNIFENPELLEGDNE